MNAEDNRKKNIKKKLYYLIVIKKLFIKLVNL